MKHGTNVKEILEKEKFSLSKPRVKLTPGKALKIYRELEGLSQLQLAEKAHLKQNTISALENDRITLGLERAKVLARVLNIHPAILAFPDWEIDAAA